MLTTREIEIPGYETVVEGIDEEAGLHCFIAVHNTALGPSLGGTRIYPYGNPKDALDDVLLLAKAMTRKSALAEIGLGGGKSVIIANPKTGKTKKLLHAFGKVVDSLKGKYIAAEDIGSSTEDMHIIRETTPYVCAMKTKTSSGDPSRYTAWGVLRGIQAVATHLFGSPSLVGKTIAISGLGNVGAKLADLLFWEGALLTVCDVDSAKVEAAVTLYGAKEVDPTEYVFTPCDILAPCALGAVFTKENIPRLSCRAIAGGANNQLLSLDCGNLLFEKQILYAPDFIINAGGVINVAVEFEPNGYHPLVAREKVDRIYDILRLIFTKSKEENKPPHQIAEELAAYNLEHLLGRREVPIAFNNP